MRNEINEIISAVLERKNAKRDNSSQAKERHENVNQTYQDFCRDHLIPALMETQCALLQNQIPAEVRIDPLIGFTQIDGIALIIATDAFRGTNLLNASSRVFILFELDFDDLSLKIHVGGNDNISVNYPIVFCPLSENSMPEIALLIKEVVREAATVYFKV